MAKLIINPTSGAKKEIPVGDKVVSIGRDPSNDLVLTDAMVSRRHAIMELKGGEYVLRDNNSSNGTLVNGDRIVDDQPLRDGDLIGIGSARILFRIEPGEGMPERDASPPEVGKQVETPTVGPGDATCPSCGAPADLSDRHCRRCGKQLPERSSGQVVCKNCKAVVTMPAQYCGNCGEALGVQGKAWAQKELQGKEPPKRQGEPARRVSKPTVPAAVKLSPQAVPTKPPVRRPSTGPVKYQEVPAGFWIRLVAYLIDGFIVGLPMIVAVVASTLLLVPAMGRPQGDNLSPLAILLPSVGMGLTFLLSILYPLYFWVIRGATPGKMLLHLRIVTEAGQSPIGTKQALLRLVGYFINSFTLGIGFLLVAFSSDKRGLHDRLAETSVMRRKA